MRKIVLALLIALAGCAPRAEIAYAPDPAAPARPIFVGSTRGANLQSGQDFGFARSPALALARFDVAVPPEHKTGELQVPEEGRRPDPQRDFLVARSEIYPTPAAFRTDLRRALAQNGNEAIVFVHGYNTNFAEGLYRFAQLGADFDLPGVLVHYSWPSRGQVMGYAYDRDSALFARDGFETLLRDLRLAGARHILIVAHSMGAALSMETLRQVAISADTETMSRVSGVVLISPDIDVDVFRAQAKRIGRLPQPFIIFTSQKDKALLLSSRLSGEKSRLGNMTGVDRLADLKVTVVDTGAFNTREGHFNIGNSPALIQLLRSSNRLAQILEGAQSANSTFIAGVVMTVQDAKQVILTPVQAIGG